MPLTDSHMKYITVHKNGAMFNTYQHTTQTKEEPGEMSRTGKDGLFQGGEESV